MLWSCSCLACASAGESGGEVSDAPVDAKSEAFVVDSCSYGFRAQQYVSGNVNKWLLPSSAQLCVCV